MPLTAPPSAPPAAPAAPGEPPSRVNPSSFRSLADAFVVWQVGFRNSIADLRTWLAGYISWASTHVVEIGDLQSDVSTKASAVATAATQVASDRATVQTFAASFGDVNAAIASASGSALSASASAAAADADSAAATAARDTTLGLLNMRPDTATAVADATIANGAYFTTPSATAGEAAILYQKSGGTAIDTGIRIPSAALVPQSLPPESGYVWALLDSTGAAALLVAVDGTVLVPKLSQSDASITLAKLVTAVQDRIGYDLSPESGYVWAVTDSQGRVALGVTPAGGVVGSFTAATAYLQPSKNLFYLGDSLTAGAGGQVTWREALTSALTDRAHTSIAIGGQTSSQIVARAGAYVALLTVAGNQIPAASAAAVTARTISLLTNQGAQSIKGWLGGVYGTLARAGDDSYSFTRAVAGTAVNVGAKMPFVPDISGHDFDTLLIFVGRNNLDAPADVKRDIAAAVALQKTAEKRFLILTPTNGGPIVAGQSTGEGTGSSTLSNIKDIEDWAVQNYGDRVLKIREFSFQFNNGSSDDLDDVAKETVPRSLRIDGVHFTTAFHAQLKTLVQSELSRRGW